MDRDTRYLKDRVTITKSYFHNSKDVPLSTISEVDIVIQRLKSTKALVQQSYRTFKSTGSNYTLTIQSTAQQNINNVVEDHVPTTGSLFSLCGRTKYNVEHPSEIYALDLSSTYS